MVDRRTLLASIGTVGTVAIAGCSGGSTSDEDTSNGGSEEAQSAEFEGVASSDVQHNVEASSGNTVRVEVDNQEGPLTTVTILNPEEEILLQERVETQSTLTTTAESEGVFSVRLSVTGTTEYEIYVDS